ncbi:MULTISPECIES: hypothetical protein [unclassified Exiguobacterium]|uniref:hypothetical protein n=1 Tax=unclassified Exiguobacterium TaxID=2644629 RepID=UPI001BE9A9B1|nr:MULTISPECIES: hypothetical protein [unclassified Exiguobacterium]MDT0172327.1 hypothetical protein [Exiguobacterium sp. BRG2]
MLISTILSTLAILIMVTSVAYFTVYQVKRNKGTHRSPVYRLVFSGLLVGLMVSYFLLT